MTDQWQQAMQRQAAAPEAHSKEQCALKRDAVAAIQWAKSEDAVLDVRRSL
jgi:hypothetical protein